MGVAGDPYMEPKQTDSLIERWVLRELGLEKHFGSAEVFLLGSDGAVTLNGSVRTYAYKLAAEAAVKRVAGVVSVVN